MIALLIPRFPARVHPRRASGLPGEQTPSGVFDYFGPQEPSGAFPAAEPTPIAAGWDTMPL
jgi:hypothetical protein